MPERLCVCVWVWVCVCVCVCVGGGGGGGVGGVVGGGWCARLGGEMVCGGGGVEVWVWVGVCVGVCVCVCAQVGGISVQVCVLPNITFNDRIISNFYLNHWNGVVLV